MITEELAARSPVCLGITLGKPLLQLRFGHASVAVAGILISPAKRWL